MTDAPPPTSNPHAKKSDPIEATTTLARLSAGNGLYTAGAVLLPAAIGAALGYWAADREVRWVPSMLGALLLLGIVALIAMAAGLYLLGPVVGKKKKLRRPIMALTVLSIMVSGGYLFMRLGVGPSPLTAVSSEAFERAFRLEARQYRELDQALQGVVRLLEEQGHLFAPGANRVPSADEEKLLADAWQTYLTAALALDRLRLYHEDYYKFDLSRVERPRHLRSYLLTFAAELSLYERTADLVDLLAKNANVVKFLDLPRPERQIAANSLASVREELSGMTDLSRVVAGKQYLRWLATVHGCDHEAVAGGIDWLWTAVERHLARIERRRASELASLTLASDFAPLERKVKGIAFPIQAGVAEAIGDARVGRPPGHYLIPPEQLEEMRAALQPGDVLLGRKNWYLSNVALPGFWPHALLYVGTPDEMARAFDQDPEVLAWVKRQAGEELTFTRWMARTYPRAWREAVDAAATSEPLVIIEAISEGVVQNAMVHAAGDYLGAMRPRLPPWVKAQAVARAHGYLGRPYDFDFDFATDTSLVCTEVVWRSYRPLDGSPGLNIDPTVVAGRRTLPANEIARLFQREHGRPDRQFDFVYFIDALESETRTFKAGEAAFLATADRPQWDIAQK